MKAFPASIIISSSAPWRIIWQLKMVPLRHQHSKRDQNPWFVPETTSIPDLFVEEDRGVPSGFQTSAVQGRFTLESLAACQVSYFWEVERNNGLHWPLHSQMHGCQLTPCTPYIRLANFVQFSLNNVWILVLSMGCYREKILIVKEFLCSKQMGI